MPAAVIKVYLAFMVIVLLNSITYKLQGSIDRCNSHKTPGLGKNNIRTHLLDHTERFRERAG